MQKIRQEVSAGGVVFRRVDRQIEFLLGKHSGYGKWVLPKGLVESGEEWRETAVREVEEEVGVRAKIVLKEPIKTIEYDYWADLEVSVGKSAKGDLSERRVKKYQENGGNKTKVHKKVVFYLMELERELESCGWEMSQREWLSFEEAKVRLAFDSEREVLIEARKLLSSKG